MNNELLFILLADDDEADRLLFTEAFSELKFKTIVQTVNNGVELMKWLNEKDILLPDLLLLDLNMPLKNGIQCLKEIKSNEKLQDISIAIFSTSNSEKDVAETFRLGANIYIHKPNDYNLLKQLLEKAVIRTYAIQENSLNKDEFLLKL